MTEGIAVIGIGCRFPGGVRNPSEFWNFLLAGGDGIVDVPPDRWDIRRFYSPDPSAPGKMYIRKGGFLRDPIDHFDPMFFGISPREAPYIDPQQRLLLEVTWEALEDGGVVPTQLAGTATGVYIGGFALDSLVIHLSPLSRNLIRTHHAATAASMTMLAARIAYTLDLRGPCLSIDTACSSSLVALHYACQDIWRGECSVAVAGGVNVMFCPQFPMVMCKGHFLSADGYCKSFDGHANGYARGEGCGVVAIKPLEAALKDGNRIYAVIHGTGINHDGHTEGIAAPNPQAQEALIKNVYSRARIPFHRVRYVEAHGTGTPVGDPIEASVLGSTIGKGRKKEDACLIGSVKANIGHLEAAAGIAGVIKAALCLKHRQVPPQILVQVPNPAIPFDDWGLKLPLQVEQLPNRKGSAYAGVSSFGYGGTNAHVILGEAPGKNKKAAVQNTKSNHGEDARRRPHVLVMSARSEGALQELARSYSALLSKPCPKALGDVCYSAATRRAHFECRLAAVAETADALSQELKAYVVSGRSGNVSTGRVSNRQAKPVFVFSGMGPQWWAMGHELFESEPTFWSAAERCDRLFQHFSGWSILAEMRQPEARSRMHETQVAQPANFVLQIALTELLRSWGIHPAAVVGHSVGEVAAAYVAGILELNEAVRVVFHRSRLQQTTAGMGKMLAIGQSPAAARSLIAGREHEIAIAAINSPSAVVLSGDPEALGDVAAQLAEQNLFHRMLQVEVPYHSPVMERLQGQMETALEGLHARAPTVPLYSTVTGNVIEDEGSHRASYWYRNMRDPVLFAAAVDRLIEDGHAIYLEIGPHPVLTPSIRECLLERGSGGEAFGCLRRGEPEATQMARALGKLYALGCGPDWHSVYSGRFNFVPLPTYPWQRKPHWIESDESLADRRGRSHHPLLGEKVPAVGPLWEGGLNTNYAPYLADHVIDDAVVFPAAAYVEAWLAIERAIEQRDSAVLEDLAFERMVVIDPADEAKLQWGYDARTRELRTYSRIAKEGGEWTPVARARAMSSEAWTGEHADPESLKAHFVDQIDVGDLYDKLKGLGLCYGPSFQCIRALWRRPRGVLARLELAPETDGQPDAYCIHPTILDASFQSLIAALDMSSEEEIENNLYVPVSIRQIRYHAKTGNKAWCFGTLVGQSEAAIEGDIVLYDGQGKVAVEIVGLRCSSIKRGSRGDFQLKDWIYVCPWKRTAPVVAFADRARWVLFVEEGHVGVSLADELRSQGAAEVVEIATAAGYGLVSPSRFRMRPQDQGDWERICKEADIANARGVVYLWPLNHSQEGDPAGIAGVVDALRLVQALTRAAAKPPQLFVITRTARQVLPGEALDGLSQAPLIGLCQVAANEFPDLRCTCIDLAAGDDSEIARQLAAEVLANDAEDQVALRANERFVQRLVRLSPTEQPVATQRWAKIDPNSGFRLESGTAGIGGLRFREIERRAPGPGEVEVRVRAAGLNFKDVIKALGLLPKKAVENTFHAGGLGMEASAVVTRVGEGVSDYTVGDSIIASLPNSFSSHVTIATESLFAVKQEDGLSPVEAASIPVVFMTAYYALHQLARLGAGDRVLIHAAAGGVGLAAVQVAKWLGAEIFATAGSQTKRAYLHDLGIAHVWDSRTLAFADGVREATGGRGVDVVLNSIPGDAVVKSLSVLAPLGRFIEIGKRDIVENNLLPMLALNGNVSLFTLDLDQMMVGQQKLVRRLLDDVWQLFRNGSFKVLPLTVFRAAQTADAFRSMAQSEQIGKIVIDMEDAGGLDLLARRRDLVRGDATYLVTGGFGGAGLEVCRALTKRGARHLAIVGRQGAASSQAKQAIQLLRDGGVEVAELRADVSRGTEVRKVLAKIAASMPPLRGIFHAAGIVKDSFLPSLNAEAVAEVMQPKALGAWHLHDQTRRLPIDLFVLFSSATTLIGNPGQANYVAANVFLDALAQHRRAAGLPALSVNWGALGGSSGMVANDRRVADYLKRSGIREIPVSLAMDALFRLLELGHAEIGLVDIDWSTWSRVNPAAASRPQYSSLLSADQETLERSPLDAMRSDLEQLNPRQRLDWLAGRLAELVVTALHLPSEKVDVHQPFSELGIDSLLAAELQANVGTNLGIQISALQLIKGGTIIGLARQLLEKMTVSYTETASENTSAPRLRADEGRAVREQAPAE